MQGGDLSNERPRRLLVTYEALTVPVLEERRVFGIKVGTTTRRTFDRVALAQLWRYTSRIPLGVEMVNYGVDQDEADLRLEALDALGTNPVNYSTAYGDVDELLAELPYRPEVFGIIDEPATAGRYGGAAIDMDYLGRVL